MNLVIRNTIQKQAEDYREEKHMNNVNRNTDAEMSMDDILSSIRKYVSEDQDTKEETPKQEENREVYGEQKDNVISLNADQVVTNEKAPAKDEHRENKNENVYQERSTLSESVVNVAKDEQPTKRYSPFEQLTNALNAYGKNKKEAGVGAKTVEQLFSEIATQIIQHWVDHRMEAFVEKIVMREIEKIKAE